MTLALDPFLAGARRAAEAAAGLLEGVTVGRVRSKGEARDLITEWDGRSEGVIRELLRREFPTVPVVGEEEGADGNAGEDGLRWLVDPIDGTVNFAHGLPWWSVVIALEDREGVAVGVVRAPALGWTYWATRGGGAFVESAIGGRGAERLAVSEQGSLESSLLVTGFPPDRATHAENNLAAWAHMQRVAGDCRRLGSAALDLCAVARGWCDGYWERRLHPWDIAAGALIVREAGGAVTSTTGDAFDPWTGDVLATNGRIHHALRDALAAVDETG